MLKMWLSNIKSVAIAVSLDKISRATADTDIHIYKRNIVMPSVATFLSFLAGVVLYILWAMDNLKNL